MISCAADLERVGKLKQILTKFVRLPSGRAPTVCTIDDVGMRPERYEAILNESMCKVILASDNTMKDSADEWLKVHPSLWTLVQKRDKYVIAVKMQKCVKLPDALKGYTPLEINRILRGRLLDEVDIDMLGEKDLDGYIMMTITNLLEECEKEVGDNI